MKGFSHNIKGSKTLALSLAVFLAVSATADDSLTEALQSSKLKSSVFSYYDMDYTEYFVPANNINPSRNHIGGMGAEINFLTGNYYGFKLGLSAQGLLNFAPSRAEKNFFKYDWNSQGLALSEAYLNYENSYINFKVGRQYYNSKYTNLVPPLVATNTDVGYKEAFEGLSARIKLDDINATIGLADFWKFSGRSRAVTSEGNGAPRFKDRVIIGGFGPYAYEFDNIFNSFIMYNAIPNISLTAAYANVSNIKYDDAANSNGDINFYLLSAGYKSPAIFNDAFIRLNFMYKGSRTSGSLRQNFDFDGNYYAAMIGLFDIYGFSFSYAHSLVSKNQTALQGVGNDCGSFTATPIYGPFLFMSFAGMNLYKFSVGYDFSDIGAKGLKVDFDYYNGRQHNGESVNAGLLHGQAPGTRLDLKGYSVQANYLIPDIKGLKLSLIYENIDRKLKYTNGNYDGKRSDEELWLRATYDFDILK